MVVTLPRNEDEVRAAFGEWLKAQRESKRKTRRDVAAAADISDQSIYRIEVGEQGAKRETIRAIARALAIDENEALARAGYAPNIHAVTDEFSRDECVEYPQVDDPLLMSMEAHYLNVPPELQKQMLGAVAQIARDYQRSQVTHGKKAEQEEIEEEIQRQIDQMTVNGGDNDGLKRAK